MIGLARMGDDGDPISLSVLSGHTGISRRYLEQLAIPLKTAGLIRGVSGRHGGYLLARGTDEITVADMIVAASGPLDLAECVGDPDRCMNVEFCACRPIWVLAQREMTRVLDGYTLEDLIDEQRGAALRRQADEAYPDGALAVAERT